MRIKDQKVKGYQFITFYNPKSLPRTLFGKYPKTGSFYVRSHMRLFLPCWNQNTSSFPITRTISWNTFPFCPATRRPCTKCHFKITTITIVPVVSTFFSSYFLSLWFSISSYNSLILFVFILFDATCHKTSFETDWGEGENIV